jgi:hypothetical protein
MEEAEKNFFAEVDQKRKSVAPAWTILTTILVVIAGLIILILFQIRNSLKNLNIDAWEIDTNPPQVSLSSEISELSKTQKTFDISLSSTELSTYLNLSDDSFPLKNSYAKIKPETVVIYGRLKSSRLGLPASITLKPTVENEKVKFVSQPTEMEKIYMTAETQDKIASTISNRISFDLTLSGETKVESVATEENKLTIFLSQK